MTTVISYTYARQDVSPNSRLAVQGPVLMADDGRPPWVQAHERVSRLGERRLVEAERIEAPEWWSEE